MASIYEVLEHKPLFLQAVAPDDPIEYSAADMRLLAGAIWPRTGIITNDAFNVTQRANAAGWAIDVAPGMAVLGDSGGGTADRYLVAQQQTVTIDLIGNSAPMTDINTGPSALRTHRVWLAVYDRTKSGTLYEGRIIVTEDTGAGAPTPGAADGNPSHVLQIASFGIAPGQVNITNNHVVNSVRHASFGSSHNTIPISDNIVVGPPGTPRVIRSGTGARLQGGFKRLSGNNFTAGASYILGRLTEPYRPIMNRYLVAPAGHAANVSAFTYRLTVTTDGNLEADIPDGYTPNWLGLDGCTYELD